MLDQLRNLGDPSRVEPQQDVGPERDRDRPLGRVAQRQARDSEIRRLLLHTAGIREDRRRSCDQAQELEVAQRRKQRNPVCGRRDPPGVEGSLRARVDRKDDRHAGGEPLQLRDGFFEQRSVDERRPVQRHHDVRAALDADFLGHPARLDRGGEHDERVDHRVADVVDRLGGAARVASGEWTNSASASWSTRTRFSSSGIERSKLRSPASTWPTGIPSVDAVSAAPSVELTSPGASTMSGPTSARTGSNRSITCAICAPCDPEPTPSV